MGWPLAISAVQILWINLVDDGLPNLALTLDPKARDLLERRPIKPTLPLVSGEMLFLIGVISVITGVSSLWIFTMWLPEVGEVEARTMVFALLSIDSLLYVFSCRSLSQPIWRDPIWRNMYLVGACGVGFGMTLVAIYVPWFQNLLGVTALTWSD